MKAFHNRVEAGRILADKLAHFFDENPLILALPRGGLPVAGEIAKRLSAPLDVLAVKKIGAKNNPELAIGAVSEDGVPVLNEDIVNLMDPSRIYLKDAVPKKAAEVQRQISMYRNIRPMLPVSGRVVILVDDGLATGATMEAAVQVLKNRGAKKIIAAVPVASSEAYSRLKSVVDEAEVLLVPKEFYSVGLWYHDFSEVTDEVALSIFKNNAGVSEAKTQEKEVKIVVENGYVHGDLCIPNNAKGIILFAHGSGSSRKSSRNREVARALQGEGFATLLFDLLTEAEGAVRGNVFDIELLSSRLILAKHWIKEHHGSLPIGLFGASTGAAAAIEAAAQEPSDIFAIVSRGGRPDMAVASLLHVKIPTLLIVGGEDKEVLNLNRAASRKLVNSRLVIIPGASHLFEEAGKLEEVIEFAMDWFIEHLPEREFTVIEPKEQMVREIVRLAKPIHSDNDLRELAKSISGVRVVMLGESTHGTQEFYDIRKRISQILIEEHGFNFIAVEGDWPDCYEINRYIQGKFTNGIHSVLSSFQRWPTWMWANDSVLELAEWMKGRKASFYGLDVYSLFKSIEVVEKYVSNFGEDISKEFLRRYSCFEPYQRDEIAYAKSLLRFPKGCKEEVTKNLSDLLKLEIEIHRLNDDDLFNARQNARVVKNAENYYRAMLSGDAETWNIRDRHMLEVLTNLLNFHGKGSKGIVWAHNTHIGDYRATDMQEEGYVNLGGLAREEFGEENVSLVGLDTNSGDVRAGSAWGAKEEIMSLPTARKGSAEFYLHKAVREIHSDRYYLKFDEKSKTTSLGRRHGQRAVGVVYSQFAELSGHNYVPTELAKRYDLLIYLDQTSALRSLHSRSERGKFPETWPSGV